MNTPPTIEDVTEEFLGHCKRGERPEVEEYLARYPELADELRELLPTILWMEGLRADGGDEPPTQDPSFSESVPEQIGEFDVLREIGRGGMGIVYEAEQPSLGRKVALKVLPRQSSDDPAAVERFQREARSVAKLHHPNIVPVFEVGSDQHLNYYAMQLVEGEPMTRVIERLWSRRSGSRSASRGGGRALGSSTYPAGATSDESKAMGSHWRGISRVGIQVAEALTYAHERGVIHRDIKPSNLIFDKDAKVWVTDFGLAKIEGEDITRSGDVVGTLRYMAPERFEGSCDGRADVYGLGATLYELLTLRPVFQSPDRVFLMAQVTGEEPLAPRSIDPRVPLDLETIVLKCLEKDPRRRYPSAFELGEDLRRFLHRKPIRARRTSTVGRIVRWVARNRALALSIVCIALLLVSIAAGSLYAALEMRDLARQSTKARKEIERDLYSSKLSSASEAIERGLHTLAAEALDEAPPGPRGWEWDHLSSRLDRNLGISFPDDWLVRDVQFCEEGGRILIHEEEAGSVFFVVLEDGGLREVRRFPSASPGHRAILDPQGETILFGGQAEFSRVRISDGVEEFATSNFEVSAAPLHLGAGAYGLRDNGKVQVMSYGTNRVRGEITGNIRAAGIPPGSGVLVVVYEQQLELFHPETMESLGDPMPIPDVGYLDLLAISPVDGRIAVTTAAGGVLLLQVMPEGLELLRTFRGSSSSTQSITFSSDGQSLIVGTSGGEVFAWDCESETSPRQFGGLAGVVIALAAVPGTDEFVAFDSYRARRRWSLGTDSLERFSGHESFVYSVTFSPSGEFILSGGWDGFRNQPGALRAWDAGTGAPIFARRDPGETVLATCFAPGGDRIVASIKSAGRARTVVLDTLTGEEITTLPGAPLEMFYQLEMHPDGERVLGVGGWGIAALWNVTSGEMIRNWITKTDTGDVGAGAISPDGSLLATSFEFRSIQLRDCDSGEILATCAGHVDDVLDVAFSPDGSRLYSASRDDSLGVWDTATGRRLASLSGHGHDVMCVAVSPDGKRIATGGRDGRLFLWDSQSLDLLVRLTGHTDYIYDVDWSPDGSSLVTGSGDGTVRLWTTEAIAPRVERAAARRAAKPELEARVRDLLSTRTPHSLLTELRSDPSWSPSDVELARQLIMAGE